MKSNPYYFGVESDHFDGLRFFNPTQIHADRSILDIARWKFLSKRVSSWPKTISVTANRPEISVPGLRITMVGHATLLIQAAGLNILTDPVWSPRASPVSFAGPRRVAAPGIPFSDLPPIHTVLLSHDHYDHMDIETLRHLHAVHAPLMAMPLGNDAIVRHAVPDARTVAGDWHDVIALAPGFSTILTPALHWSARGLRDRRMALWSGHYLRTPAGAVWFAGDTGYGDGAVFRYIRARHGAPRVALIPIGAYAPRWFMAPHHADPAQAVRILHDIAADRALGIHWGTFRLADEPWEEAPVLLADALAASGDSPNRFVAARPGECFDF